MTARRSALLLALLLSSTADAQPTHILRMATVIPDGTPWAREVQALARGVEAATGGALRLKVYFGGIAGDEIQSLERIKRDQLDGTIGSMACLRLAPSMRITRVPGLLQSIEENNYVLGQLKPQLDSEYLQAGFINLGAVGVGATILFTRSPVASMADLKRLRFWVWDADETFSGYFALIGAPVVPLPIYAAAQAYEEGRLDGFVSVPTGALAFQWSTQAHFMTDLQTSELSACMLVSTRFFDNLPIDVRKHLRAGVAKLIARWGDIGQEIDRQLVGQLFHKQGLRSVPVSDAFRREFLDAARLARESGKTLLPEALLQRVLGLLADFRGSRMR